MIYCPADMTEITEMSLIGRLRGFMETEARSGSMDLSCITPLYVYRMWGGDVSLDEIESTLKEIRQAMFI